MMHALRIAIVPVVVLMASSQALAQVGTGFTITDGDVVFTQVNSPTSGTATSVSGANLRFNGAAGTDHLFENWWWYRIDGVDAREFAFNNASGTTAAGNTATTTWPGLGGGAFSATLTYVATDTGTNLGQVVQTLTVTNLTQQAMRLNLFNYADFDVNATAGSDAATLFGPGEIRITDTVNPAWDIRFIGSGASAYQVTSFATLRGLLTNTAVDNLNNTGLPFGPGDFTGGFQWVLDLGPGGTAVVSETLASVPEPTSVLLLSLAGLAALRRR